MLLFVLTNQGQIIFDNWVSTLWGRVLKFCFSIQEVESDVFCCSLNCQNFCCCLLCLISCRIAWIIDVKMACFCTWIILAGYSVGKLYLTLLFWERTFVGSWRTYQKSGNYRLHASGSVLQFAQIKFELIYIHYIRELTVSKGLFFHLFWD